MSELTEFLLARIAEQESAWREGAALVTQISFANLSRHMLAECEAKRRIVEEYRTAVGLKHNSTAIAHLERCLWALALPYADHPDYDERWRP